MTRIGCFSWRGRFSERYSKEFGVPIETLLRFLSGDFKQCIIGHADLKEELAKHLSEWRWRRTVDELLHYWFRGNYLNKEILPYIEKLRSRGIKCLLATNQEKHRLAYLREGLGLGRLLPVKCITKSLDRNFWNT